MAINLRFYFIFGYFYALDEYPSNREVHIVAEYNFTIFAIYLNIQGAAVKGLNLFFFFSLFFVFLSSVVFLSVFAFMDRNVIK